MRVVFSRDERFAPPERPAITVRYRAGCGYTVKRAWGAAMVAAGACVEVIPPPRPVAGQSPIVRARHARRR